MIQTKQKKEKISSFFYPFLSACLSISTHCFLQKGEELKTFWEKIGIEITEDNNIAEV